MAWQCRKGQQYFYRARRVGSRVVSEYVGRGQYAELVAARDARQRAEQTAVAEQLQRFRAELVAEDRTAAGRFRVVQEVVGWALEQAGFHRHDRGNWRRRRMASSEFAKAAAAPPARARPTITKEDLDGCVDALGRAHRGDESAVPLIRKFLAYAPDAWLRITYGDLAKVLEEQVVEAYAGKNLACREGIQHKLTMMRAELEGPAPSAVEQLLVERTVACWLDIHILELQHAARAAELSPAAVLLLDRRRTSANRRYLAALKTLASVRKLGLPTTAIQVNVGLTPGNAGPEALAAKTVEALPATSAGVATDHSFRPQKSPERVPELAPARG